MERLIRMAEAAELLGRPVGTLRQWRRDGTGPRSVRIGRHVSYRVSDIEAWVDQQYAAAVQDA